MRNFSRVFMSAIFTWAQFFALSPAIAASPQDVKQMRDFFNQIGVTQRNVKLKDLYEKTKATLPQDLRFEIELYLEMNPNAVLPKIEMKTVKNGNKEDLQLNFTEKGQSGSLLLSLKSGEIGRLNYSLKGKTYSKPMKVKDLVYPVRFLTGLAGPGYARSEKVGFSQLFNANQVAALKVQDRQRYQNHIRELLEAAEKVQQKHILKKVTGNSGKERKTSMIEILISGDPAWANSTPKDGAACLTMGWTGAFKSGVCEPPKEAYRGSLLNKCFVCNPAVYGREICGKTQIESGSDSTVGHCNSRIKEWEQKNPTKDGTIGSIEALKKKMADGRAQNEALTLEVNKLLLLCQTEGIQDKECKDLREKVSQLRRDNCAFIDDNPSLAGDMKCYFDPNDPIQAAKAKADAEKEAAAASAVTVQVAGAGTDGTPGKTETITRASEAVAPEGGQPPENSAQTARPVGEERDYSICAGLPVDPSGLGCSQEQVRETQCIKGGESITFYYCSCGRESTARPTSCESSYADSGSRGSGGYERSSSRSTREYRPVQRSWWEQGTSSNFMGPMLGLLGSLGMIWLSHYQMKQQLASQYSMLQPQVLQIAPTAATLPSVSTGGMPVIQGR